MLSRAQFQVYVCFTSLAILFCISGSFIFIFVLSQQKYNNLYRYNNNNFILFAQTGIEAH